MEPLLKIQNLTFKYKNSENYIFQNFNMEIGRGEFVSLLGASGSGKTTLLRILAGLEPSHSQELLKDDIKISYMPQRDSLLPWRNILENITLPLEIMGIDKKEAKKRAEILLENLSLDRWISNYPKELSGGMRQRISFARTLISQGELLLLDEPFSALDAITKISLREWLLEIIRSMDRSFLFVTHDIDEALELSDKIFVIEKFPISGVKEFRITKDTTQQEKLLLRKHILNIIRGEKNNV